jgi:hypothetical protein
MYIIIFKYCNRLVVEKPEGEILLGKRRHRGDDIKMVKQLGREK